MKVILRNEVPSLGGIGDVVNVKDGYAINYLIPRQIAIKADTGSVRSINHQKMVVEHLKKKMIKSTTDIKLRLESTEVVIEKQIGEQDKLFGAVTSQDISDALDKSGIKLDKRKIELDTPIHSIGLYNIVVKLQPEIIANLKVKVIGKAS
ncbi:MAG: 50S ribosomal protein L9 [Deltaproteobacteria bacterium]|nr:50S ribosomal protein L9 [Deltaproteobacteria bacterium]MCL5277543.1 50S ribosomal protein L9 [Deltaproteobacteria bacterium]